MPNTSISLMAATAHEPPGLLRRWKGDLLTFSRTEPLHAVIPADMFGVDSYEKGGYVLHMLREQIGDAAFFKTMQTYAARFANRNATDDDILGNSQEISGRIFRSFSLSG